MESKTKRDELREWAYPLAEICSAIAQWQMEEGRHFVIRHPYESKFWELAPVRWLTSKESTYKLNWSEYWQPTDGNIDTDSPTYLLHNLPLDTFVPLLYIADKGLNVSRERRSQVMNSIQADCLMTMFPNTVDDRQ